MTERPATQQSQILTGSVAPVPRAWSRFKELVNRGDFQLALAFSLIGLLITLNLIFRFPELGAVIAQYNQF
jgi:hypothetical protein